MAIAPFLPGIFFFWSPSIIMTPALSADSCPVLHGSVRGRVIAFFAGGGGGVGRRSLRRLTVRPNENTQRSNLSPGVVVDAADASYSSSGEPSELNMTVAVAVLLRRPAGGWDACASTRRTRTDEGETALLLAARLHLFFGPRAEEGPRPDRPRAAEKGASNTTVAPPACLHRGDGGEPSGSSSPPPSLLNIPIWSAAPAAGRVKVKAHAPRFAVDPDPDSGGSQRAFRLRDLLPQMRTEQQKFSHSVCLSLSATRTVGEHKPQTLSTVNHVTNTPI